LRLGQRTKAAPPGQSGWGPFAASAWPGLICCGEKTGSAAQQELRNHSAKRRLHSHPSSTLLRLKRRKSLPSPPGDRDWDLKISSKKPDLGCGPRNRVYVSGFSTIPETRTAKSNTLIDYFPCQRGKNRFFHGNKAWQSQGPHFPSKNWTRVLDRGPQNRQGKRPRLTRTTGRGIPRGSVVCPARRIPSRVGPFKTALFATSQRFASPQKPSSASCLNSERGSVDFTQHHQPPAKFSSRSGSSRDKATHHGGLTESAGPPRGWDVYEGWACGARKHPSIFARHSRASEQFWQSPKRLSPCQGRPKRGRWRPGTKREKSLLPLKFPIAAGF